MTDEQKIMRAKANFATLCQIFEEHDWRFDKDESELTIDCHAQGEDLPISVRVCVSEEMQLAILFSYLPFEVPKEKRLEMAVAVSFVNSMLIDGNFAYNINSGDIIFRMTNSFADSNLGTKAFTYMLLCSFETIDEFNDKFLMLAKGILTIDDFIEQTKLK